jgi:hypothetical protein
MSLRFVAILEHRAGCSEDEINHALGVAGIPNERSCFTHEGWPYPGTA